MLIAYIPLLVCIVGFIIYATVKSDPWKFLGTWLFIIGLFWTIAPYAGKLGKLG